MTAKGPASAGLCRFLEFLSPLGMSDLRGKNALAAIGAIDGWSIRNRPEGTAPHQPADLGRDGDLRRERSRMTSIIPGIIALVIGGLPEAGRTHTLAMVDGEP